ncbi:WecB/TagA/CpsF family glycosyltransferase [Meinhardsimonia xiamenensis]|jgi:N-acetylglucosaminyldiphosphoundecaprenol N-acetyl-beta-D-mannosaminyltransferase|nr:WecB/TagA/CpsF family glycosyltransferase [Meinhardsimonia xiamenensis]
MLWPRARPPLRVPAGGTVVALDRGGQMQMNTPLIATRAGQEREAACAPPLHARLKRPAPAAMTEVLGIPLTLVDLDTAAARIRAWARDGQGRYVGVRDVASTEAMSRDPALLQVARGAAMNLADGMPLVWLARARGLPATRAAGPDLMEKMLSEGGDGLRHFLYGGAPGVAERLAARFAPRTRIVGVCSPAFRPLTTEEDAAITAQIRDSGADVVWVGISSPRQDVWMAEHVDRLPATLIGVGAAFDFLSGARPRAPRWMQRAGLEWSFRLATDFRRLWPRYLIGAPRFLARLALAAAAGRG